MIGKTVSHYQILEKLGAGGMGEVYRAEDSRLSRQVAIKVLPDIFSGDPERMARFGREAKLLASLSHQNIASIHGLEEADGKRFIVMERPRARRSPGGSAVALRRWMRRWRSAARSRKGWKPHMTKESSTGI
jgi:hypothetical protein